jgi:hypothetical protein
MGKGAIHVPVIVDVDGPPIEYRMDEFVKRQVWPTLQLINGKETEYRRRQIIEP